MVSNDIDRQNDEFEKEYTGDEPPFIEATENTNAQVLADNGDVIVLTDDDDQAIMYDVEEQINLGQVSENETDATNEDIDTIPVVSSEPGSSMTEETEVTATPEVMLQNDSDLTGESEDGVVELQSITPVYNDIDEIEHKSIATGNTHVLMINSDGTVSAWGGNTYGQLGNGTYTTSLEPVTVQGLTNIIEVSAGDGYSVALNASGEVYAWGRNSWGMFGNGTIISSSVPVLISDYSELDIVKISTAGYHVMTLASNGDVYTCGTNGNGQLGIGDKSGRYAPTLVSNLPACVNIAAAGFSSYAVDSTGSVWSWGNNNDCNLGFVNSGDILSPSKTAINNIEKISSGHEHCVVVSADGLVYTFGSNRAGQLGVTGITSYTPQKQIVDIQNVKNVYSRCHFNIAVKENGDVYAWGRNDYGQLGINSDESIVYAPQFVGAYNFSCATSDVYSAYAVDENGNLYKWGYMPNTDNSNYNSTNKKSTAPLDLPFSETIKQVDSYRNQTLAISNSGEVYAWGEGYYADGTDGMKTYAYPTKINGITDPIQVSRGKNHNLVLDKNGDVWGWGSNSNYPMGGNAGKYRVPTKINGLENVIAIAAGTEFSIFLKSDGTLWGLGKNDEGQLGQGAVSSIPITTPVQITDKADFQKVEVGESYVAALASDGVYTWGDNMNGTLGNGTTIDNPTPGKVSFSFSDEECISDISAGVDFCLALTNLGNVYAWGDNGSGELGQNGAHGTPSIIPTLNNIKSISAGKKNGFAIKTDGTVYGWGYGYDGQLGFDAGSEYVPLDPDTIKSNTVYVKDLDNNSFTTQTNFTNPKSIIVTGDKAYKSNTYYTLTIDGVKTLGGNGLTSAFTKRFLVE